MDHDPTGETSPEVCFEWATLFQLDRNPALARAWLEHAVALNSGDPWYHLALAKLLAGRNALTEALGHWDTAVALRPDNSAIRLARARFLRATGDTARAEIDEAQAIAFPSP